METAARPDGPGVELYTRIVFRLRRFYENIFRETQVSWPKTKEGLQVLLEKYPESLAILSEAAMLATMAEDREMAKPLFDRIGDRYLAATWKKPGAVHPLPELGGNGELVKVGRFLVLGS